MSEWVEHDGGPQPVSSLTIVQVRFRNHEEVKDDFTSDKGEARDWSWWQDGGEDDIIAYRVVEQSDV